MSKKAGLIKVKLLTGKTVRLEHPGQLPSVLIIHSEDASGRPLRLPCIRIDADAYRQMTIDEMVAAGLLKRPAQAEDDAETQEGGPGSNAGER